jgi:glycosidase
VRSVADVEPSPPTVRGWPSPSAWEDEVIYFLLVDRFSDGAEDGFLDATGAPVPGRTPPYRPSDNGTAVATAPGAARWRDAGQSWVGGTLRGARSKLGYVRRLGATAIWLSPVLRQVTAPAGQPASYHGYGTQNFLEVDPHFGTAEDLRALVDEAHGMELRVILDVILNHTGDVFGYAVQADHNTGALTDQPSYSPTPYQVAGWRTPGGALVPFTAAGAAGVFPDGAVWPAELTDPATFSARGRIRNWDDEEETTAGDFETLKDVHHGAGDVDHYRVSPALTTLTRCYQYWLGFADLDGMRVDTVKHMDRGATRYFASAMHEYAQTLGKDRFYLIGEVAGSRELGVEVQELTGVDAVLGLGAAAAGLVATATGAGDPAPSYFDLFRNSELIGKDSHAWLRDRVVTSVDDHDQIRQGRDHKARFAATPAGPQRALAVLALNVVTLGIPCLYYGSEQLLDGEGGDDRYIREAMFGGEFGPFRTRDRHVFDETAPTYREIRAILDVRRAEPALRRGRQYLREISGDGSTFGPPTGFGGPVRSVVGWSRILADTEVLCLINTDVDQPRSAWVVVDAGLTPPGSVLSRLYASDPAAAPTLTAQDRAGTSAVQVTVAPGGVAVYR